MGLHHFYFREKKTNNTHTHKGHDPYPCRTKVPELLQETCFMYLMETAVPKPSNI